MAPIRIVSPHRDDAAFSCGILLHALALQRVPTEVLNVFSVSDYAPFSPFLTVSQISELRRQEDYAMQRQIGEALQFHDLELQDAPLRLSIPSEDTLRSPLSAEAYEEEVEALARALDPLVADAECVAVPLGWGGHIDHAIVRDAICSCCAMQHVAFYEDLPYAVHLREDERSKMVGHLMKHGSGAIQSILISKSGGADLKRRLCRCYPSQIAPETGDLMANYAHAQEEGEVFYAGSAARAFLATLVRSA